MTENIKNSAVELTDEEAGKAAGGNSMGKGTAKCKKCKKEFSYIDYDGRGKVPTYCDDCRKKYNL